MSNTDIIIHDEKDNVGVVVIEKITPDQDCNCWIMENDKSVSIQSKDEIPLGHKIAMIDLNEGDTILKYGHDIGKVVKSLKKGDPFPITDERMTRFNITLNHGVEYVISCFKKMMGGELFVPKLPSYRITDLAKAIKSNIKLKVIGIRPGEKIHEELINSYEAKNTIELKNYYLILPTNDTKKIKKYCKKFSGKKVNETFSYTSENNKDYLSIRNLKQLIKGKFLNN